MNGIDMLDAMLTQAEGKLATGATAEAAIMYRMIGDMVRKWLDKQTQEQEEQREKWRNQKATQQLTIGDDSRQWSQAMAVPDEAIAASRQVQELERMRRFLATAVFLYWQTITHHPKARLDRTRESKIMARLRENDDDASELFYVVDGTAKDDFLMGRDPRTNGKSYNDIGTIFRNREQVERLAGACPGYQRDEQHRMLEPYLRRVAQG